MTYFFIFYVIFFTSFIGGMTQSLVEAGQVILICASMDGDRPRLKLFAFN